MRAVIQRVNRAEVSVDGNVCGKIEKGILLLLGVAPEDTEEDLKYICDKTLGLRIFCDENDKMNLSLMDIKGEILVVSQFTLFGDCRKGRRPSFSSACPPEKAEKLYEDFLKMCEKKGIVPQKGIFGADMKVSLENDGPVTLILDSTKIL